MKKRMSMTVAATIERPAPETVASVKSLGIFLYTSQGEAQTKAFAYSDLLHQRPLMGKHRGRCCPSITPRRIS